MAVGQEPQTYYQAGECENFQELACLIQNRVNELVEPPKHLNIVNSKWVYKFKSDTSGNFHKF